MLVHVGPTEDPEGGAERCATMTLLTVFLQKALSKRFGHISIRLG